MVLNVSWFEITISLHLMDTSNSQWCISPRRPAHLTRCGVFGGSWDLLKNSMQVGPHPFLSPAAQCCHHLTTTVLRHPAAPRAVPATATAAIALFHSPAAATCSCCSTILPLHMAQLPNFCHCFSSPALRAD